VSTPIVRSRGPAARSSSRKDPSPSTRIGRIIRSDPVIATQKCGVRSRREGLFSLSHKAGGPQSPDRTIVVGDTPYHAEAAAKAGLRTISLLRGGWSEDEWKPAECVAVFKDPADLLARQSQSP
jgi:phosphoglycolate phosphatase-like HAD superfamily hydrolase